jgi:molybdopterin converting factor small subunit
MTGGQAKVEVEGATVAEVIAALEADHPGFSAKLLGDDGNLVKFVNVFVDDDDVRFLDGLATPVADGVEVSIMQAVAGG